MEYTRLGRSGMKVSRVGLGCMSYGQAAAGMHQWTLDEDAAAPFFQQAVELGVSFWDTANVYQGGTSEEFVGRAIYKYSRREDIVVATKVHGKMHDGPSGSGLSRKAILEQLDGSLRRLGTDDVDVYYIHRFDDQVPVEETLPDRRCHQTQAPQGRGSGPGSQAHRRRDDDAGGAVHRAGQLLVVTHTYSPCKRVDRLNQRPQIARSGKGRQPISRTQTLSSAWVPDPWNRPSIAQNDG
jgi:aldo/keto reductase family protein